MEKMRIQKYLSQEGILSRREAEDYIRRGLIKLNGKVVREMGVRIDPTKDKVEVFGNKTGAGKRTLAFNKPRGLKTEDIIGFLPEFEGLNCVGRLDRESEGLILLSNDGIVTKTVTGNEHLVEKEYEISTQENVMNVQMRKMSEGVKLEDSMTLPAKAEKVSAHAFDLTLKEGRKHQIRRMAAAVNLTVVKLKRVRVGNITLSGIPPGKYRLLSPAEVLKLKQ